MSQEISKQSFVLMLGRGACFIINLVTPLFLVRYFSTTQYGDYRQMMLILTSFSSLLPLGFPSSLYYFLPNYPREKGVYLSRTIAVLFLVSIIFSVIFMIFNKQIAVFMKNDQLNSYFVPLSLAVGMLILSVLIETVLVVENKVKLSTQIMTYTQISRMVIIILCGIWGGVTYIVYGLLFLFTIKSVGSLVYFRLNYQTSFFSLNMRKSSEHFNYALTLGMGGIFVSLCEIADKYIVSNLLGLDTFAVYSVGCYELPFIAIVFGSIADVALPTIVQYKQRNATDEVIRLWHYSIESSMLIGIPIFISFFFFANQFIVTVFTNKYAAAVPVFRIALLTVLLEATRYGMITRAYSRTGFMFFVTLLSLLLMVPSCYFGITHYGIVGAISSVMGARFFIVTAEIIYSKYILSLEWHRLLPFIYIAKILLLSMISAEVSYMIARNLPELNKWLELIILFTTFGVIYAYLTNIFKFWKPETLPFPEKVNHILHYLFPR